MNLLMAVVCAVMNFWDTRKGREFVERINECNFFQRGLCCTKSVRLCDLTCCLAVATFSPRPFAALRAAATVHSWQRHRHCARERQDPPHIGGLKYTQMASTPAACDCVWNVWLLWLPFCSPLPLINFIPYLRVIVVSSVTIVTRQRTGWRRNKGLDIWEGERIFTVSKAPRYSRAKTASYPVACGAVCPGEKRPGREGDM